MSVGLGSVQADLHAGVLALQWIVGAYALTFASAMLAFGMIGDEFGRKKVMMAGAGVFCAGSVLCALAPNAGVLIAWPAVMGLGAAASEPGTLSMLRHLYRDERARNRAIGVWAAVAGLALAVGPVLGGILIGIWDWRAIFWFNLIFGAAALAAAAIVLPENADPEAHRVDVAGAVLGSVALAALIFGVMTGESAGFTAPAVLALFCVSVAAGCAFLWREYRAAHPLLDLRFLRVPQFATANVVAFCSYFATFAIFFFTALSSTRSPVLRLPDRAGVLADDGADDRRIGTGGHLGEPDRTTLVDHPRLPDFRGRAAADQRRAGAAAAVRPAGRRAALTGAGIGWTVVPITSSVISAVPPERSGMAASAANTSREVGAVTGVAVLGALVNAQLHADLVTRLTRLGIPAQFQSIVVNAIETGGVPPSGTTTSRGGPGELRWSSR